ncbi:MAG: hypothetical protein R2847_02215 [Bacteroidia bacterium]
MGHLMRRQDHVLMVRLSPNYTEELKNLDGNLTGANAFYHLDVFKSNLAYRVYANQDFDGKR